jgi:hypothetical protein
VSEQLRQIWVFWLWPPQKKLSTFIEIQCNSGLQSAILICTGRPTSGYVGSVTINTGMVENVGKAVGISAICHSIPEIQCTSGLVSAILNCATRPTSGMLAISPLVRAWSKAWPRKKVISTLIVNCENKCQWIQTAKYSQVATEPNYFWPFSMWNLVPDRDIDYKTISEKYSL